MRFHNIFFLANEFWFCFFRQVCFFVFFFFKYLPTSFIFVTYVCSRLRFSEISLLFSLPFPYYLYMYIVPKTAASSKFFPLFTQFRQIYVKVGSQFFVACHRDSGRPPGGGSLTGRLNPTGEKTHTPGGL